MSASRNRRAIRRVLVASAVALVAGVVFVLTAASVAAVPWDPQAAVVTAWGATFLPQSLIVGEWLRARTSPGGAR